MLVPPLAARRADHRRHRRPGHRRERRRPAGSDRAGGERRAPGLAGHDDRRRRPLPADAAAAGGVRPHLPARGLRPRAAEDAGRPRSRYDGEHDAARRRRPRRSPSSSESPVIDLRSTTLGVNLDQQAIEIAADRPQLHLDRRSSCPASPRTPTRRTRAQTTITVYGSSGAENTFIVDGVNTTGVEYGFQGKELNFEFIQEIDVKTGGYEAEYGRSTGGIINVITKSGGNEFHGDVFGYFDDDSLQATPDDDRLARRAPSRASRARTTALDLGGYLVKDRLWFFGAYDRVIEHRPTPSCPPGPPAGDIVDSTSDRDLGAGQADLQHHRRASRWSAPSSRIRATTPARSTTPTTR